jgi:hypothetical protein
MGEDQDLIDLVNAPKETLTVEIKSNLDLENDLDRANLARHIAALANYGGGFIAFGFGNDMRPAPLSGDIEKAFHPDRVSSIAHKYLEPTVLCDVVIVQSTTGQRHPVIRVPSHGTTPVCAKADGPQDAKGRVQGIMSGRYYIRAVGNSGPESAVLTRPEQWHSLIRRLLTADRAALAAMIERAIDPRPAAAPAVTALDAWHDATAAAFVARVNEKKLAWSVPLAQNYYQLSYEFVLAENERIAGKDMLDILQRANSEMRDLVWTGWSMFYPFTRPEIAPYFVADCFPGQGTTEVLETDLLGETSTSTLPDFWRVSSDGKASIVRAYREDRSGYPQPAGQTVSLFMAAREAAEFVRHARAMAPHFKSLVAVRFRCEWRGLQGRQLRDPESDPSIKRVSRTERVLADTQSKPEDLTNTWPEIVSELVARLARAFDLSLDPGPGWVLRIAPRFRSL